MASILYSNVVTLTGSDQTVDLSNTPFNIIDVQLLTATACDVWVDEASPAATKKKSLSSSFPQFVGSHAGAKLYLNGASGTVDVTLMVE